MNRVILRRILGVGKRSGVMQLYSELGIYPLRVRRATLALRYLRYLVQLPETHLARKALMEADRSRRRGEPSWFGDLAIVLRDLPFALPTLPSLAHIDTAACDDLLKRLREGARRWIWDSIEGMVSLPLLHGRLEPQEKGAPRVNQLCRRHYLSRVLVTDHRLALTRLLCASFYFRGVRSDLAAHSWASLLCRKCGLELETPGHVFLRCRDAETVLARHALRDALEQDFGKSLPRPSSLDDATRVFQQLIFDWDTVVPTARFVYKVVRNWRWFGRRLPTMVSELTPETDEEGWDAWDFETATEDGSEEGGDEMEIDI
ncbi:hypothetical protein C8F01DRAFT_1098710 [Mycena amicta]|nr:hypothetical protein C8F01DRAFT_1098710 [Mycena amicta]